MSRMRAVQISTANGPFELVMRDIPTPGPRQARIKVQACGICAVPTGNLKTERRELSTPLRFGLDQLCHTHDPLTFPCGGEILDRRVGARCGRRLRRPEGSGDAGTCRQCSQTNGQKTSSIQGGLGSINQKVVVLPCHGAVLNQM